MKASRVFARVGAAVFVLGASGAAIANPPTQNVIVTNPATSPVPVTGNVGLTGTPTVNVGNSPKPSQLVSAELTGGTCTGPANGFQQFAISVPTGMVLVVNHVYVDVLRAAANTLVFFRLVSTDGTNGNDDIAQFAGITQGSGVNTVLSHDFQFPTGVVVRSGWTLCVGASDGLISIGARAQLYGYLATDE